MNHIYPTIALVIASLASAVEASTLEQYITRQNAIADIEYDIEIAKKNRELEELNGQINPAPSASVQDAQIQYFGATPPAQEVLVVDTEGEAISEEEEKREQEREAEISALRNARLIEVYQTNSGTRRFVAIVDAGNERHEVWRGQRISNWEVVGVDLDSVILRNDVLNARRIVKHVR